MPQNNYADTPRKLYDRLSYSKYRSEPVISQIVAATVSMVILEGYLGARVSVSLVVGGLAVGGELIVLKYCSMQMYILSL